MTERLLSSGHASVMANDDGIRLRLDTGVMLNAEGARMLRDALDTWLTKHEPASPPASMKLWMIWNPDWDDGPGNVHVIRAVDEKQALQGVFGVSDWNGQHGYEIKELVAEGKIDQLWPPVDAQGNELGGD